jgi:cytochrome P450
MQLKLAIMEDMKVIVDETLNMLLAGRDTVRLLLAHLFIEMLTIPSQTASLLTYVTYCLAIYPHVRSRLREEIILTVGMTRSPKYNDKQSQ